jgi:hypothetical protein
LQGIGSPKARTGEQANNKGNAIAAVQISQAEGAPLDTSLPVAELQDLLPAIESRTSTANLQVWKSFTNKDEL